MMAYASVFGDRRRAVALVVVTAFVASLVISLLSPLLAADGVVGTEPFVEALRARASELRPGDRVLVHPPWRDDVVEAIERAAVLPAGVEATTALSPRHGEALRRVLVLADPSAPLPRSLKRALAGEPRGRVAGVDVTLLASGAASGSHRLDERLAEARVYVVTADDRRVDCRYSASAGRHVCPGLPEWMYVGPYTVVAAGRSHECVWSHPTTKGRVVTRFEDVRLPEAFALSHGLSDNAARNPRGAKVTVTLKVDGVEIGRAVHENRGSFDRERFAVPKPGGTGDVEVEVTTPDDGMRHFCWSLEPAGGER